MTLFSCEFFVIIFIPNGYFVLLFRGFFPIIYNSSADVGLLSLVCSNESYNIFLFLVLAGVYYKPINC